MKFNENESGSYYPDIHNEIENEDDRLHEIINLNTYKERQKKSMDLYLSIPVSESNKYY